MVLDAERRVEIKDEEGGGEPRDQGNAQPMSPSVLHVQEPS
jgi:hypothetical protein